MQSAEGIVSDSGSRPRGRSSRRKQTSETANWLPAVVCSTSELCGLRQMAASLSLHELIYQSIIIVFYRLFEELNMRPEPRSLVQGVTLQILSLDFPFSVHRPFSVWETVSTQVLGQVVLWGRVCLDSSANDQVF